MAGPQPLRLLLIADPAADLSDHQKMLARASSMFHLTTASDPSPLLRGRRFDCVLIDGSDKAALASQIRRHHPRVAVLVIADAPPPGLPDGVRVVGRASLLDGDIVEEITGAIMTVSGDDRHDQSTKLRRRPLHVQLGNEDIYEELVETMNEGILTVDRDGLISYANRRIEELLGVSRGTLLGRDLRTLMSHGDGATFEQAEPRSKYDIDLRDGDGPTRNFLVSQSPLSDGAGRRIGTLLVLSDVTEVRDYQQRLVQSEKMVTLGELLASVAHELNNPLCTIMGYSQLLRGKEVGEEIQRMLEKVADAAQRCNRIVQGLLSFSRRKKPEKTYVGLNGILREVINILAYDLKTHNVEVNWQLDELLPKTMADFHQLQQVFLNIIGNARQAIYDHQKQGRITIRSSQKGGRLRVEIEDDGPGIPGHVRQKIFDPFFTTKEPGKGTGLGLSISYGIVKEHGGEISVRSDPGQGACFTMDLPIVRATAEEAPKPSGDSTRLFPALARRSFLVIDDEPPLVDLLHTFLTQQGATVDTASNGNIGLQKLLKQDYDAVICDMRMPGMSGDDLYRNLEEVKPDLMRRFLFVTGDILSDETKGFLEHCGAAHIMKPFYLKDVARRLQRIVAAQSATGPGA